MISFHNATASATACPFHQGRGARVAKAVSHFFQVCGRFGYGRPFPTGGCGGNFANEHGRSSYGVSGLTVGHDEDFPGERAACSSVYSAATH